MTTYRSRRPQTTGGLFLTDGGLPTGRLLQEAIEQTDEVTGGHPACYMSNCAHPTRFRQSLSAGGERLDRVRGLRANASTRSQVELHEASELDDGDPVDPGNRCREPRRRLPGILSAADSLFVPGGPPGQSRDFWKRNTLMESMATANPPIDAI